MEGEKKVRNEVLFDTFRRLSRRVNLPDTPRASSRSALRLSPKPRAVPSGRPCRVAFRRTFFSLLLRFVSETEVAKGKRIGLFPFLFPCYHPGLLPRQNLDFGHLFHLKRKKEGEKNRSLIKSLYLCTPKELL